MSKILLVGVKAIKGESIIEENVDEKILSKVISNVQDIQLKPILGKALYESVCNEAREKAADNLYVIPEPTNELLNDYIQPFLIHAVVAEFIAVNNYKISNKGVQKLTDNSSTSINASEVEYIKNYYDNYVSTYKNNLIKFLQDNDLISCGSDTNITQPTTGWFLEGIGSCYNDSDDYSSNIPRTETDPVWLADKPNYVPNSRTITINGVTFDLSANRSWTISASSTPTLQEVITAGSILNSDNTVTSPTGKVFTMKTTSGSNESRMIQDPTFYSLRSTTSLGFDEVKVYGSNGIQINSNLGSYILPRTTPLSKQVLRANVSGITEWGNEGLEEVIAADPVLQSDRQIQISPNKYLQLYTSGTAGETTQKIITDGFFVTKTPAPGSGLSYSNTFTVAAAGIGSTYQDYGVCDSTVNVGASGVVYAYNNYVSDKGGLATVDMYGITLNGTFNSMLGYFNALNLPSDNSFGMVFSSDAGGYTFPRTTPTVGQTLIADASGNLVFGTISGGSTPPLGDVLAVNNSAFNSIYLADITSEIVVGDTSTYCTSTLGSDGNSGILKLSNSLGGNGILHFDNSGATDKDLYLPRTSGTLAVTVNSKTTDVAGNVDISLSDVVAVNNTVASNNIIIQGNGNEFISWAATGFVQSGLGNDGVSGSGYVYLINDTNKKGSIRATNLTADRLFELPNSAGTIALTSSNITGSAATLTTSRNINGVAFNGSADITVTAAAATLTGTTLASGVTTSSLTSFGASPTLTTPTFTTSATTPLLIGGTGTTSTLTLKTTTGVGTTGADFIVQGGNNGASELMRITNAGAMTTLGNVTAGNNLFATSAIRAGASSAIYWNGRASMYSSADAVIDMRNNANSAYASVQSLYSRFGSGSPEGVVTAPIGTYYSRTDGGTGTSLYVKESGTGNTGWVAK